MTKAALSYMPSQVEQWKENRRQRRGGEFWKLAFVCLTSFPEVQPFASLSVPTWGRTRALLALRSHLAYTILNDLLFGFFFFFGHIFTAFLICLVRTGLIPWGCSLPNSIGRVWQVCKEGLPCPLNVVCCALVLGLGEECPGACKSVGHYTE